MNDDRQLARTIREIVRDEIRRHVVLPPPGKEWTDFQRAVYDAVFMIPYGKVATFGGVASRSGHEGAAESVGNAIRALGYDCQSIPWWRVVYSDRKLPQVPDEPRDQPYRLCYLRREGIALDEHDRVPERYVCDW